MWRKCRKCGQMIDTRDPLTIQSNSTGFYYHSDCTREYGSEMSYIGHYGILRPHHDKPHMGQMTLEVFS